MKRTLGVKGLYVRVPDIRNFTFTNDGNTAVVGRYPVSHDFRRDQRLSGWRAFA